MKCLSIKMLSRSLALAGMVLASQVSADPGRTPLPDVPQVPAEKATQCVEPVDVMRRDHMEFILHQRDETMHRGIRTEKYSLKGCIDCHVSAGPDGEFPSVETDRHFCNSCHSYAGVKIDCFECHNDKPEQPGNSK